jgi:hypothetical protein
VQPGTASRARNHLIVQAATIRDVDRGGLRRGRPITSPARTLADLLRHCPAAEAVAVADHALRTGAVQYEDVVEVLAYQREWPYAARASTALQLSDPRRETWLESYSFVNLHHVGLALPEPQVDILDAFGRFVARVDGLWDGTTVGEPDGRVKYDLRGVLGALADPQASAEELISRAQRRLDKEKIRRDLLNDLGLEVVRWGLIEVVHDLAGLAQRIERRRTSASTGRFTGRLRFQPAPQWLASGRAAA